MKKDPVKPEEETEETFELKRQEFREKKLKEADKKVTDLLNELAKDGFLLDAEMITSRFGNRVQLIVRDMKKQG